MLKIYRVDYKNCDEKGHLRSLPLLHDLRDITDINEVRYISVLLESREQANEFQLKFPKSYKAKMAIVNHWNSDTLQGYETYEVSFHFNTFWLTANTGEVNETALKNREKVIKKLSELI